MEISKKKNKNFKKKINRQKGRSEKKEEKRK